MADRTARIRLTAPDLGAVEINGQDVSRAVVGFRLEGQAGYQHRLTLDLLLAVAEVDGHVVTDVPADTAALLVDLGWTPPDDGQPVDLTDPKRHDQIIKIIKAEARRDPNWFLTLLRREERKQGSPRVR